MNETYLSKLEKVQERLVAQMRMDASQRVARLVAALRRGDLAAANTAWHQIPIHVRGSIGDDPATAMARRPETATG